MVWARSTWLCTAALVVWLAAAGCGSDASGTGAGAGAAGGSLPLAGSAGVLDGTAGIGASSPGAPAPAGGVGGGAVPSGGSGGSAEPSSGAPPFGGGAATGGGSATAGAMGEQTGGAAAGAMAGMPGGADTSGAGGSAGAGTGGVEASPIFHVFLLLGQSNMAGYPKAQAADRVEDPRIRVLGYDDCAGTGRKENEWDVAVPPLHECWNGAIGPGDWFAKTLIEQLPETDTIGLVPCAISGERIETFLKDGGAKYGWILERARLAQEAGGVIEGILFHQGESNNGDPSWPGKVNALVTDLRADLGIGDAPFLAGELAYDGGGASHNPLVGMLPSVVENAYVVSANGLALDPADTQWRLHFGHDAQVTFGQRYAEKMVEALGW